VLSTVFYDTRASSEKHEPLFKKVALHFCGVFASHKATCEVSAVCLLV